MKMLKQQLKRIRCTIF